MTWNQYQQEPNKVTLSASIDTFIGNTRQTKQAYNNSIDSSYLFAVARKEQCGELKFGKNYNVVTTARVYCVRGADWYT